MLSKKSMSLRLACRQVLIVRNGYVPIVAMNFETAPATKNLTQSFSIDFSFFFRNS